jgi:hypothetical protein
VLTAVMFGAAIAIAMTLPGRAAVRSGPFGGQAAKAGAMAPSGKLMLMPEDIRKRLEELLAAAQRGEMTAEQKARVADIYNLFTALNSDLDPDKLDELARAMDPEQGGLGASKQMMDLAGKIQTASESQKLSPEMQKQLRDLGMQISEAADAEQRAEADKAAGGQMASSDSSGGIQGKAESTNETPKLDPSQIQLSTESQPGGSAGMMMLSSQQGPKGAQSSGGYGGAGNSGPPPNGGTMPGIEQALKRETIEASTDTAGANVLSETRHQTERGQATVGFTRGAGVTPASSSAEAPPAVPEDRRAAVQSYFTRKQ